MNPNRLCFPVGGFEKAGVDVIQSSSYGMKEEKPRGIVRKRLVSINAPVLTYPLNSRMVGQPETGSARSTRLSIGRKRKPQKATLHRIKSRLTLLK
jgi:hypothetical protein